MAKKTFEERCQDLRDAAQADSVVWGESSYLAHKRSAGIAKARLALQVKVALAAEQAQADHSIEIARAQLIDGMTGEERESYRKAKATINGLESSPKLDTSKVTLAGSDEQTEATLQ